MLNALAQCVIVISHLLVCPAMRTGPRAKTGIARTAFVEHHDALALVSRCGCGVQAGKTAADNQYIAFVFGFCRSFDFGDWQLSSNTLNELRFTLRVGSWNPGQSGDGRDCTEACHPLDEVPTADRFSHNYPPLKVVLLL